MRDRIGGLAVVVILGMSGCGGDGAPSAPTPQPAGVVRVEVQPGADTLSAPGATVQLRAIATLSDGTQPDVSNEASWAVTDPAVLAVSSRGLVTAVAPGRSLVTATYRFSVGQGFVIVR